MGSRGLVDKERRMGGAAERIEDVESGDLGSGERSALLLLKGQIVFLFLFFLWFVLVSCWGAATGELGHMSCRDTSAAAAEGRSS